MDDGKTLAYKRGESLRIEFSCEVTPSGLILRVGEHRARFAHGGTKSRLRSMDGTRTAAITVKKGRPNDWHSIDPRRHMLSSKSPTIFGEAIWKFEK